MQFIQGNNLHQTFFSTLEEHVAKDNPIRLYDFIDKVISTFTNAFVSG